MKRIQEVKRFQGWFLVVYILSESFGSTGNSAALSIIKEDLAANVGGDKLRTAKIHEGAPPTCTNLLRPDGEKESPLPKCKLSALYPPLKEDRYFRPPLNGDRFEEKDVRQCLVHYAEANWADYCANKLNELFVPDRLVFFFLNEKAEWEREPIVDHVAPVLMNLRMRDMHSASMSSPFGLSQADLSTYVADYDIHKTALVFHLMIEGDINKPQEIIKELIWTVDCLVQQMRVWYSEGVVARLLSTAKGVMLSPDHTGDAPRLHHLLHLFDVYRSGAAVLNADGSVTTKDPLTGTLNVSTEAPCPPNPKYETPNPPLPRSQIPYLSSQAGPNNKFILPEITTILGASDEMLWNVGMLKYNSLWRALSPGTRTFMRQYAPRLMREHAHSTDDTRRDYSHLAEHVEIVMSGFRYFGKEPISPQRLLAATPSERRYVWSFVGTVKGQRQFMIDHFTNWTNTIKPGKTDAFHCCEIGTPREVYIGTIFVPVGRGNYNLDCFRVYEAAGSGAIPVIAAPAQEIFDTFGHFVTSQNELPPFLFAETWADAVREADRLLRNPLELQRRQERVVAWFFKNLWYMQKRITGY